MSTGLSNVQLGSLLGALHQVKASTDAFDDLVRSQLSRERAKPIRQYLRLIDQDLLSIRRAVSGEKPKAKVGRKRK